MAYFHASLLAASRAAEAPGIEVPVALVVEVVVDANRLLGRATARVDLARGRAVRAAVFVNIVSGMSSSSLRVGC